MNKYRHQKKWIRTHAGFSLIELMVSLTIFSIVMTISIGTLLVIVDANAKAQALYSVMTNLSFAVDSITRNLRTGKSHYCAASLDNASFPSGTNDCASGESAIAFTPEVIRGGVTRIGYRLNGTGIEQKRDIGVNPGPWQKITGDDVVITTFDIVLVGSATYLASGDAVQPEASLLVEGYINNGLDTDTDFRLQTNIVKRVLDF